MKCEKASERAIIVIREKFMWSSAWVLAAITAWLWIVCIKKKCTEVSSWFIAAEWVITIYNMPNTVWWENIVPHPFNQPSLWSDVSAIKKKKERLVGDKNAGDFMGFVKVIHMKRAKPFFFFTSISFTLILNLSIVGCLCCLFSEIKSLQNDLTLC